jgi:hypothetical protein
LVDADGVNPELGSRTEDLLTEIIQTGPEVRPHEEPLVVQVDELGCFVVAPSVGDSSVGWCGATVNRDEVKMQRGACDADWI